MPVRIEVDAGGRANNGAEGWIRAGTKVSWQDIFRKCSLRGKAADGIAVGIRRDDPRDLHRSAVLAGDGGVQHRTIGRVRVDVPGDGLGLRRQRIESTCET